MNHYQLVLQVHCSPSLSVPVSSHMRNRGESLSALWLQSIRPMGIKAKELFMEAVHLKESSGLRTQYVQESTT